MKNKQTKNNGLEVVEHWDGMDIVSDGKSFFGAITIQFQMDTLKAFKTRVDDFETECKILGVSRENKHGIVLNK